MGKSKSNALTSFMAFSENGKFKKVSSEGFLTFIFMGLIILTHGCKTLDITLPQETRQTPEFSLKDFVYTEKHLDISHETEDARATFWKPDGTLVFITGRYANNVVAYKVNELWQIHTAELLHDEKVPGEFQHGLYFREDGKMM